jgi:DNA-binding SARP family transcriptional activator
MDRDSEVGRVDVSVLGPTMVAGDWVTPRQRALVAVLALHRTSGACIDLLADGVWGGGPPASARSSLQNQISRLRRAYGSDFIVCRQGRYHLEADTDVDEFKRLVASRPTRRPSTEAIADLAAGLDLWRGTPFHDVPDHNAAEIERADLEQLRATAVEHLAVGRIIGGLFSDAASGLTAHIKQYPLDERAWELLAGSLYYAGRRTDALAAYERHVAHLDRELSVEPSETFRRLRSVIEDGGNLALGELLGEVESPQTVASLVQPGLGDQCHCVRSRRDRTYRMVPRSKGLGPRVDGR